jgi:hypothetical protein
MAGIDAFCQAKKPSKYLNIMYYYRLSHGRALTLRKVPLLLCVYEYITVRRIAHFLLCC